MSQQEYWHELCLHGKSFWPNREGVEAHALWLFQGKSLLCEIERVVIVMVMYLAESWTCPFSP